MTVLEKLLFSIVLEMPKVKEVLWRGKHIYVPEQRCHYSTHPQHIDHTDPVHTQELSIAFPELFL